MGKVLRPEQLDCFRQDGFVAPISVLTPGEVSRFLKDYEAYEAAHWGRTGRSYDDQAGREFLREPQRRARWAYDLVTHPRILDVIEDLLGPNIMVWDAKMFPKPARSESFVSWHQDGTYLGLEPKSQIVTA